ncbi:hypothetical protein [Vibrio sp. CyArs1]|uniref:hypothetical protein n=1 Tax=Vibrio sp. CyArs1 TaxID=2682577 RepID=UPI001F05ACE9|nr:hypothetical protein [Vibrio sp. CyArs1]
MLNLFNRAVTWLKSVANKCLNKINDNSDTVTESIGNAVQRSVDFIAEDMKVQSNPELRDALNNKLSYQAQEVLRDPVFIPVMSEIQSDALIRVMHSRTPEECWVAKCEFNAIRTIDDKVRAFTDRGTD